MDSNLEYRHGPHHIHEIVPNLTIILKKMSGDCKRKLGGGRQMFMLANKGGRGVKNLQNPVYVICVRPL